MADFPFALIAVMVLALAFDFSNGLNDAANAIATVVGTRVLSPAKAIIMSASLNVVGAFMGTAVAKTVGAGIITPEAFTDLYVVIAALATAALWTLVTTYYALPISASHALIASLVGAGLAMAGTGALIASGLIRVIIALLIAPIAGFAIGFLVMVVILWLFRSSTPERVHTVFGRLQILSAAFMAFSHGNNDAQKTMGIMTMALLITQRIPEFAVPWWVILLAALAMGSGTAVGGWRVIRTLGMKIAKLRPVDGFAAETSAAMVITVASHFGLPLSTTHVISAGVTGVGSTKRLSAVRWGIARSILLAWILTFPVCGIAAWGLAQFIRLIT
jgi:PiT family inorganic phosphate transporter